MSNFLHKFGIGFLAFSLLFWNINPVTVFASEDMTTSTSTEELVTTNTLDDTGDESNDDTEEATSTPIVIEEVVDEIDESPDDLDSATTTVVVDTGDAVAVSDVDNKVNINIDDVDNTQSDESSDDEGTATSTDEVVLDDASDVVDGLDTATTTATSTLKDLLEVDNSNDADINNDIVGSTNSGSNSVVDNDGGVVLTTGNSLLISNIFNLINLNIIGAKSMTTAINIVGNIIGDLDLSRYSIAELADIVVEDEEFQEFTEKSTQEEDEDVNLVVEDSTTIRTDNNADVENNVSLEAISGNNEIYDNGSVTVKTGDVFVASNVANIVNTTVVGDNFTLAIINIVGGNWDGNLILPSLTVNQLQDSSSPQSSCQIDCQGTANVLNQVDNEDIAVSEVSVVDSLEVTNNNDADINNTVSIITDSGSNNVSDNNGDIEVETGDVVTMSQVLNFVNTNILGDGRIFGIINMMNANWSGNIWGVPADGFVVNRQGSYITFQNNPNETLTVYSDKFDDVVESEPEDLSADDGSATITNTDAITTNSTALIDNNVVIDASSGNNDVSGNNGDVKIETGNVAALSNIFNLANTNIVGDNTTFAVINILGGEWNGDINFGMPDLQIIEVSQADPDPAVPGGYIDYTLVVTNKGDAPATNVKVTAVTNPSMVDVVQYDNGELDDFGVVTWNIPELGVGDMKTFYYRAKISEAANNNDLVANHVQVTADQDDRNSDDNRTGTEVYVFGSSGASIAGFGVPVVIAASSGTPQSDSRFDNSALFDNPIESTSLKITQSNDSTGLIRGGQTVAFTLDVENTTDESLYDVVVWGEIKGPGGVLSVDSWSLGEVFPREKITIKYSVNFIEDALPGTYTNTVWGDGFDVSSQFLTFPETKDVLVIRDSYNTDNTNVVLGLEYYNKYVNYKEEDYLSVTNNGNTGIDTGILIIRYNPEYLIYNNDSRGSFAIAIPSLQPGESYNVNLTALPVQSTDRTQIELEYVLGGVPVSGLTIFQSISEDDKPVEPALSNTGTDNTSSINSEPYVVSTSEIDNTSIEDSSAVIEPKVLGYEEVFDDVQNNTVSSIVSMSNLWKYSWLIVWFVVMLLLLFWKKKRPLEQ